MPRGRDAARPTVGHTGAMTPNRTHEPELAPEALHHPRMPRWAGDLLAAAAVTGAAFVPFPEAEFRVTSGLTLALAILPAAILPLRRRWPIPVLAAILLLYGVVSAMGTLAPGIVIAASVAMFGVTNRIARRAGMIVTGCAVLAVVLLSLLPTIGSVFDPRTVQFAVTVAFAAAAGDATRSRREYIRAVLERAERAEQSRDAEARRRVTEERLRIARDLHDAVAHQISVISLNAGVATSALSARPERAKEALSTIRTAARTVLREIGDLLEVLRADEDGAGDHTSSPQPGLERLDELIEQFAHTGLTVNVRTEGDLTAITGAANLVAYRVIQEGLTNAHKHGAEHRAHVLITVDDEQATVVVTNPIDPATPTARDADADARGGHGLVGLRERVASVRGTVSTGPTPGGFRTAATLPLSKELRS